MNTLNKYLKIIVLSILILVIFLFPSCNVDSLSFVKIVQDGPIEISIGSSYQLEYECSSDLKEEVKTWESDNDCLQIDEKGLILAKGLGKAIITLKIKNYCDSVVVQVSDTSTFELQLSAPKYDMTIGESIRLTCQINHFLDADTNDIPIVFQMIDGIEFADLDLDVLTAKSVGIVKIVASSNDITSNVITITIREILDEDQLLLFASKDEIAVGETIELLCDIVSASNVDMKSLIFEIIYGKNFATINENKMTGIAPGQVDLVARIGDLTSNTLTIIITDSSINEDPYKDITEESFYSNYLPANSYMDAYYRTLHGFMSGSIDEQSQEPTLSEYRPQENGVFLRNSSANYSLDGNTYYILDSYGNVVHEIYKGGGYITLEEVAAYIFAFGEIPANYVERKKADPTDSIWGKYLRLNNSYFSGDTARYPYEPVLPNIRGCGGELYYYEVDIGTTGTDCDPRYPATIYNNGYYISRGAARIVYTRFDANGDKIIDINEKYLFYTYNHYNDFQEYLNYEGGWGEKFGNITGGGEISSSTNYNPTSYIPVIYKDFKNNASYKFITVLARRKDNDVIIFI